LPDRLNGEEYLRFLSDTLGELLAEVPLDIMQGMWYAMVNESYPERWMMVQCFSRKIFGLK
jgi:hypothetical protein